MQMSYLNPSNPAGLHAGQFKGVPETRLACMQAKAFSLNKILLPDWPACRPSKKCVLLTIGVSQVTTQSVVFLFTKSLAPNQPKITRKSGLKWRK